MGEFIKIHSKKLEETFLWKAFLNGVSHDSKCIFWVKKVYDASVEFLKDVRKTFQNYTLHDETHILNVIDAMGGLLGDKIERLSIGEIELLILVACLHDLGMVYLDEEKQQCFTDKVACKKFLQEYYPDMIGSPAEEWEEDIRQWYLRTLHPFRLPYILQNGEWKKLFDKIPREMVSKQCILAVCQAHGETTSELRNNEDLKYLSASKVDPLFCACLLRLGDLLDFDDTRAPRILYKYVEYNDKSREEWDKHQASAGFFYPESPSTNGLPYKARCTNPRIEHAVRDFLDLVDDELDNCIKMQNSYSSSEAGWRQEFPFPRNVLRDEIEADGYMSGDFCMTMDQEQVLKLLTGERLYNSRDVFVRELLQNAIDATLLRGEMKDDFRPEESRIDLWEWNDKDGNIWFRIDDQGTGMTLNMLQKYFLKIGNSYYTSKELEWDLRNCSQVKSYQGISRFGIGFLSCFLCGDYIEVSTLYCNEKKNQKEESASVSSRTVYYGIRLQMTGLTGYYTLKYQAKQHPADGPMPAPDWYGEKNQQELERYGYRSEPGTSIAVRLNPGKLGSLNLRKAVKRYLCCARVPVYYDGERIGRTYNELMQSAHEIAGEKIYELTPQLKKQFDETFPHIRGRYPNIAVTVIPLDIEEGNVLPGLSGVLMKYDVRFDKSPWWRDDGVIYKIKETFGCDSKRIILSSSYDGYKRLGKKYDYKQNSEMVFSVAECGCPVIEKLTSNIRLGITTFAYHGIASGGTTCNIQHSNNAIFWMENECRPTMRIDRSYISELPLKIRVAVSGIIVKYEMTNFLRSSGSGPFYTLEKYREIKNSHLGRWLEKNLKDLFTEIKQKLQKSIGKQEDGLSLSNFYNEYVILTRYSMACMQDDYQMTINYESGQKITFSEKETTIDVYALFPPMMFCKAASNQSRQYICAAQSTKRRGITEDHPFIEWLIKNTPKLNKYYPGQFQQITESLCNDDAEMIIKKCDCVREQLLTFSGNHGIDARKFPKLNMDDFWQGSDKVRPFQVLCELKNRYKIFG